MFPVLIVRTELDYISSMACVDRIVLYFFDWLWGQNCILFLELITKTEFHYISWLYCNDRNVFCDDRQKQIHKIWAIVLETKACLIIYKIRIDFDKNFHFHILVQTSFFSEHVTWGHLSVIICVGPESHRWMISPLLSILLPRLFSFEHRRLKLRPQSAKVKDWFWGLSLWCMDIEVCSQGAKTKANANTNISKKTHTETMKYFICIYGSKTKQPICCCHLLRLVQMYHSHCDSNSDGNGIIHVLALFLSVAIAITKWVHNPLPLPLPSVTMSTVLHVCIEPFMKKKILSFLCCSPSQCERILTLTLIVSGVLPLTRPVLHLFYIC